MSAAPLTMDLGPSHPVAAVGLGFDRRRRRRRREARPTGARIELGAGIEQRFSATDAPIDAIVVTIPIDSGERSFGPLFSGNPVLLGREQGPPFLVPLPNFIAHGFVTDPLVHQLAFPTDSGPDEAAQ